MLVKQLKPAEHYQPITVQVTFETKGEAQQFLQDIADSSEEDIQFSELNALYNIVKDNLKL